MINFINSRQDKFGFYQVGDFRTYSKFEAAEQQVKTGQKMRWNFNDTVYQSFDWTQEPVESSTTKRTIRLSSAMVQWRG